MPALLGLFSSRTKQGITVKFLAEPAEFTSKSYTNLWHVMLHLLLNDLPHKWCVVRRMHSRIWTGDNSLWTLAIVVLGPQRASHPLEQRWLTLPFAKYKAGREVLLFVLTQLAWKVRHFLVAEDSTSAPAVVISQRMAAAFAQHLPGYGWRVQWR